LTDTTQADKFTTQTIAFTSCDPQDYPGELGVASVIQNAITTNITAMILYSQSAENCNITGFPSGFQSVYTMTNTTATAQVYDYLKGVGHGQNAATQAAILTENAFQVYQNQSQYGSYSGAGISIHGQKTTAIAMIALYAITGIITILFLVIIVTGAIRAHNHPERYGPRNIIGRARQSRAKGLARAMLDTIPIVKFGEPLPAKHGDVELTENEAEEGRATPHQNAAVVGGQASHEAGKTTGHEHERAVATPMSEAGSAADGAPVPIAANAEEDDQMCSICTDNFTKGEDIRVLPCNHMFHPACVDPWLLDVSGTCPLCRINLNPTQTQNNDVAPPVEGGEPTAAGASGLAPPLDPTSNPGRHAGLWRALFGEHAGPANTIPVQRTSGQDTVAALRRYRESNRTATDSSTRQHDEQRRRRFFSRRNRAGAARTA